MVIKNNTSVMVDFDCHRCCDVGATTNDSSIFCLIVVFCLLCIVLPFLSIEYRKMGFLQNMYFLSFMVLW
jgi:hypothetical protein